MRGFHAQNFTPAGTLVMEGLGISRRRDLHSVALQRAAVLGTTTTILRLDFSSSVKASVHQTVSARGFYNPPF